MNSILFKRRGSRASFLTGRIAVCIFLFVSCASFASLQKAVSNKTLVAWVYCSNLAQRGGGVLSIEKSGGIFDAIVFGEIQPQKWMAGSDFHKRTAKNQDNWPKETSDPNTLIQIAIVYDGNDAAIYRNGQAYSRYSLDTPAVSFGTDSFVLLGRRHLDSAGGIFSGSIEDARIYDVALTQNQIKSLKPDVSSEPAPIAWWDFESAKPTDRINTFPVYYLFGNARTYNGRLLLPDETSFLVCAPDGKQISKTIEMTRMIDDSRRLRHLFLNDKYRPGYHFTSPEGICMPFDVNGGIYWRGRYHLFYIFQDSAGKHCWGHISSTDLVHWRHHPTALEAKPGDPESGIFSGNCFINQSEQAVILYHGVGAGNCIALSNDEELNTWIKYPANPVVAIPKSDDPNYGKYESWDPFGWLEAGITYAIFGGNPPTLFSKTGTQWQYLGKFIAKFPGVADNEDVSCPDFFRLGNKFVLMCISHNRGCRYYIGRWSNEKFYPQAHYRMSWLDNTFFAPESLQDNSGRRIMWAWILDGRKENIIKQSGWSGIFSLPRVLSLAEDGNSLKIDTPEELKSLRYNPVELKDITIEADSNMNLQGIKGNSLEIDVEMASDGATNFGMSVCCSDDGREQTDIYCDVNEKVLVIDTSRTTVEDIYSTAAFAGSARSRIERAPFELKKDEPLKLKIFIDKSVVEVFANSRQALVRNIYPSKDTSIGVKLFSKGGLVKILRLEAWQMMPSNPY